MPATFAILFLVLMAVGVPIALALSLAPIIGFMLADKWTFLNIVPQKLRKTPTSFRCSPSRCSSCPAK